MGHEWRREDSPDLLVPFFLEGRSLAVQVHWGFEGNDWPEAQAVYAGKVITFSRA